MPRSRGGQRAPARAPSAPSRPTAQAPPPRTSGPQQQQRAMTTTAPGQTQAPPAQAGKSPGLFGQMASTAAGVAVGSSIGHAIGGFFGGGSSAQPAEEQQYQQPATGSQDAYAQPMDDSLYNSQAQSQTQAAQGPCATDIKSFTKCMDDNQGNMTICGWYLDQLKACQQAAGRY